MPSASMQSRCSCRSTSRRRGSACASPIARSPKTRRSSGASTRSVARSTPRSPTRARTTRTTSCSPPPASTSSGARCSGSASSCPATAPSPSSPIRTWPARTVIDPALLATLPEAQRREGMSEVVKTGLLAGEPLWELPDDELVRRCAAFKAAVCLRDPHDRGERAILNLGHTFAHALEAAAGYEGVTHGRALALGLLAALRLSGRSTDVVEDVLQARPVRGARG